MESYLQKGLLFLSDVLPYGFSVLGQMLGSSLTLPLVLLLLHGGERGLVELFCSYSSWVLTPAITLG